MIIKIINTFNFINKQILFDTLFDTLFDKGIFSFKTFIGLSEIFII